jgi:hypothetical protein
MPWLDHISKCSRYRVRTVGAIAVLVAILAVVQWNRNSVAAVAIRALLVTLWVTAAAATT